MVPRVLLAVSSIILLSWSIPLYTYASKENEDAKLHRVKRIIGGQTIYKGQWPWLVSLRGKVVTKRLFGVIPIEHKYVFCGGSVLNDRWILTAAHCFDPRFSTQDPDDWEVKLASVSLISTPMERLRNLFGRVFKKDAWLSWEMDVDRIVIHPRYRASGFWTNDIALLKMEQRVPSGNYVSAIRRVHLPEPGNSTFPRLKDKCIMKGWGCTSKGGTVTGVAKAVELPILEDYSCTVYYGMREMGERICAGYSQLATRKGICPGDSGGPLVCQIENGTWVQTGIASFTSSKSPDMFPGAFTRVSSYVDWINSIIT